jgi:hypothetical protein
VARGLENIFYVLGAHGSVDALALPMILSNSRLALAWREQFAVDHQRFAAALLDAMVTVSGEEFLEDLKTPHSFVSYIGWDTHSTVRGTRSAEVEGHTEPTIPRNKRSSEAGNGAGPTPVEPTRVYKPGVGSEGLVAHLITELSRSITTFS